MDLCACMHAMVGIQGGLPGAGACCVPSISGPGLAVSVSHVCFCMTVAQGELALYIQLAADRHQNLINIHGNCHPGEQ